MIDRERDAPQLASNALALLATLGLAAAWWAVRAESWRDPPPPPVPASAPSIEVALQQDLPPTPAAAATPPQPEPPQQHFHRTPQRRNAAATAPAEPAPAAAAAEPVPEGGAVVAAAGPPAAATPPAATRADLDAQYAAALRADIDRRTQPPDSAQYRLRRPSGEVRVGFVLIRSGELKSVRVLRSSGSSLLDDAAVTIVSTGHYPPMSADLFAGEAQHTFSVTIEFRRTG